MNASRIASVAELQREGILRVEDGNHGEYRPRKEEFVANGVAFIRAADMDAGSVLFKQAQTINEVATKRITKGIGRPGDVLISHKGTVGKVAAVPLDAPPFVCSPQTTFWRTLVPDVLDRDYLYAFLRSPEFHAQLAAYGGETDMAPYVSLTSQRAMKVRLPLIGVQRAIGTTMAILDRKLELNRRMNETLEAMAQAIFRDWFVDFGPVRRKMEGATDPVVIMGGLTPDPARAAELAALFPATLGEDGLPQGWRAMTLAELAVHCKGSVTPLARPDVEFEHYSLPAFDAGQEPAIDGGDSIKSNKTPVPEGSVLLSKLNPEISRVWLPNPATGREQIASTEFLIFQPRQGVGRGLLYFLFRDPTVRQTLAGMVTGTSKSHQRISPPALLQTTLLAGEGAAFEAFEGIAEPILKRVLSLRAENRTLAETRDYLLPRLMSGAVQVKTDPVTAQ